MLGVYLKNVLSMVAWLPSAAVYAVLMVIGLLPPAHRLKLYREAEGRPDTWWERAIRNPVSGQRKYIKHPYVYYQYGDDIPHDEVWEQKFYWRFRRAKWMSSLRLVWTYGSSHYGEVYVGWKLGSAPPDLDFGFSVRPYNRNGT